MRWGRLGSPHLRHLYQLTGSGTCCKCFILLRDGETLLFGTPIKSIPSKRLLRDCTCDCDCDCDCEVLRFTVSPAAPAHSSARPFCGSGTCSTCIRGLICSTARANRPSALRRNHRCVISPVLDLELTTVSLDCGSIGISWLLASGSTIPCSHLNQSIASSGLARCSRGNSWQAASTRQDQTRGEQINFNFEGVTTTSGQSEKRSEQALLDSQSCCTSSKAWPSGGSGTTHRPAQS